jgi:hypothetical protein
MNIFNMDTSEMIEGDLPDRARKPVLNGIQSTKED